MISACPSCGAAGLADVYRVDAVPVQSCLLLDSQADALDFPRGDVVLGFCERCGFVTNVAFDESRVNYAQEYDGTQAFSSTFTTFANELAETWIERYDLSGVDVVEIGCGTGEFLSLLCDLGDNRGVGFDPSVHAGRAVAAESERVRLVRDVYSDRYADVDADFVCCRHTLEHIPDTYSFLTMLRTCLRDRLATVVAFELPGFSRILDELAFWDIYYEHCSYFTEGALARLFHRARFDVLDLRSVFGGQYIVLEARPAAAGARSPSPPDADLERVRRQVERFKTRCPAEVNQWRRSAAAWRQDAKRVALWGSGSKAVGFLSTLGRPHRVECVVDINPNKHGKYMPGRPEPIVAPEELVERRPDVVVIMNAIYRDEIVSSLDAMGVRAEVVAL